MAPSLPDSFDVIVVGAGPGGSTTAAYLGRLGRSVLLLDKAKFPRDKTCGDALSGKSMNVVRELGLVAEVEKLPHGIIKGATFSSPNGKIISIPFPSTDPNRPGGTGYCLRRQHPDYLFFTAAKNTANVTILEQFQIQDVLMEDGKAVGVKGIDLTDSKRAERTFSSKVVVGADGVNSIVARAVLGEKAQLDPSHSCDAVRVYYEGITGMTNDIEIHFIKSIMPGYFWIFPLENGRANVGLGLVSKDLQAKMKKDKTNLVQMLNHIMKEEPLFKERFANAKPMGLVTGWRLPFGSYRRQLSGNGWVLVGDAASLVDPFSGEGVGNATTSGRLAAQFIDEAIERNDVSALALGPYEVAVWEELGKELSTSYKMQQLGRHEWLLNLVIGKAARKPAVRDLISASLASDEAKKKFESPLTYLWLLLT
ncbi:Digeranylgeranylglycerophospholipid reductase [uncultured archaeon]|nr:Digeranylgeranylglycerophospholipid reductase [uncultured archaeon]